MRVLGIDTTKKNAKIFLVDTKENEKSYFLELNDDIKHSEGLFLYIEKAMLENRIQISEVDCFACVVGPGSFTGIRVGMATIKGLNKALNKSVVSLNTFELLMSNIKNGLILLNSTNTSCYYAKVVKSQIVDTGVIEKNNIVEFANGGDIVILKEEQELVNLEYNNCKIIDDLSTLYSDAVINKLNSGDYGEFLPYYLQLSQAERNLSNE